MIHLFQGENKQDPSQMSALALAYVGDAVYDLYIRLQLVREGTSKPNALHKQAIGYVSAKNQRIAFDRIKDHLTQKEYRIAMRGRNAKPGTIPKNADPADYAHATALETLIGYLFLTQEKERLEQLLSMIGETADGS